MKAAYIGEDVRCFSIYSREGFGFRLSGPSFTHLLKNDVIKLDYDVMKR